MAVLRVGTSGYAYKEWKGSFYPKKLADREMLPFYGRQFPTVEINYTFYRMPSARVLDGWSENVPDGFQFALKANQKITHFQKLRDCEDLLRRFLEAASVLASKNHLGPVLVQLPPSFKADLGLLEEFLKLRPLAFRFAFEFRHPSWHTPEMHSVLRRYNTALCLAETDKQAPADIVTADFVYVRLRKEAYTPEQLAKWKERFSEWLRKGIDVYAYVKHEDAGKAPTYACRLLSS